MSVLAGVVAVLAFLAVGHTNQPPPTRGVTHAGPSREVEHWPARITDDRYADLVKQGRADYTPGDHLGFLVDHYSPTGTFFHYGHVVWSDASTGYRFDADGVPRQTYDGKLWDHPVTFERYALHLYDQIIGGDDSLRPVFFRVVDRLLATQDGRGAFAYPFGYKLFGYEFKPGWPSAMAQGMGLSVLRRAYALAPRPRYLAAGDRAVSFLTRSIDKGGVRTTLADLDPSLSAHLWLEEFPTEPANYKLNGFLFTLFGLYDWHHFGAASLTSRATADHLWREGVDTAARTVRYFDLNGFTTPYLHYMVVPGAVPNIDLGYHRVHIYQMHLLKQIAPTADERATFAHYEQAWRADVGD